MDTYMHTYNLYPYLYLYLYLYFIYLVSQPDLPRNRLGMYYLL